MKIPHWLAVGWLLLGLWACVPGTSPDIRPELIQVPDALPGAQIGTDPVLTVSYPAFRLYPDGAVLPDPAGLDALEALAGWLQKQPRISWQLSVWREGDGPEERARAQKRIELLHRFFERKGMNPALWAWRQGEASDVQLRLVAPTDSP